MAEKSIPDGIARYRPEKLPLADGATVESLSLPEGFNNLLALAIVNTEFREALKGQVGMSLAKWTDLVIDFYKITSEIK